MYCGKIGEVELTYPIIGLKYDEFFTYVNGENGDDGCTWMQTKQMNAKLVLRNLSDLTKLEDEILIRWGGGVQNKEAKKNYLKEVIDNMLYSAYKALRYDEIEFMLENHIDAFGLIPQGLAIDANTLQTNPYK